jgi:septal ring factor EnvC (AmiA/AmiB activator)
VTTDRRHARFLAHCNQRARLRTELAKLHREMAALTDRENVLMADLHNVNHAIDELLEQKRAG